jgi:PBP1b-binding outer membrane lipoprotein LpoB
MKLLIVIAAFVLAGCSTTAPVVMKFPDVPKELLEACPNLKLADNSPKLSAMLTTVTQNYALYKNCQIKQEGWVEWYKSQKQIFESVK